MVGFSQSFATDAAPKEDKQDLKSERVLDSKRPLTPDDPLEVCFTELEDLSSFLDFDSIDGWFLEGDSGFCSDKNMSDLGPIRGGVGDSSKGFETGDGLCKDDGVDGVSIGGKSGGNVNVLIEEQLGKVSLEGKSDFVVSDAALEVGGGVEIVNPASDTDQVGRTVGDAEESSSDVESESESSSSSTSCSSDEDADEEEEKEEDRSTKKGKKKEQKETVIEEGEIVLSDVDEMVGWSDNEDDGALGPIKSKNEVMILPPVPSVTVTLEPHHQTLPVGMILSIVGVQVIVEGAEQHNPLSEGSILWITESRTPLGIVDEIFGPVKNPYYIVRYNSETELPAGIQQGTPISFVPEFVDHVLNDKSLYQKGYDASGENDEELLNEMEFSDDEKEAEYRRMLKMKKRGTNEPKPRNKRKDKRQLENQSGNWNHKQDPAAFEDKPPVTEDQHPIPPPFATSSGAGQNMAGNQQSLGPQFWQSQAPPPLPPPCFSAPRGFWNGGFQLQHPSNMGLSRGPPPNGMPWMQQNLPNPLYQGPMQTGVPFPQQIGTFPNFPVNFNPFGGQPNFGAGPALGPWRTCADQNILNTLQFGMGFQAPQASLPQTGGGEQVMQPPGFQADTSSQSSSGTSGKSLNFNQGRGGGGRRGQQRGRGRFGAGSGRHQNR